MCLILFAHQAHRRYPLILAANRDEAYARPAAPAAFWDDHPHIYGGRDLEKGGTWLGLTRCGRMAAVTNYRNRNAGRTAPLSRGALVSGFLTSDSDTETYLERVKAQGGQYNGFILIAGDLEALYWLSNRGPGVARIPPGVHGLSNHLLNTPWPKIKRSKQAMEALLLSIEEMPDNAHPSSPTLLPGGEGRFAAQMDCHPFMQNSISAGEAELAAKLFELLSDRSEAPDDELPDTGVGLQRERELSPIFINGDRYGTRASTVMLVDKDGDVLYIERGFGAGGKPLGEVATRFRLENLTSSTMPGDQAAVRA